MKHHKRFSDWPSFNQINPSPYRQPMAKVRKLLHRLRTPGSSIDPDLQEAINVVRSGRVPIPPDASIAELVEALDDKELSVRADAAYQLGMRKDAPIGPLLNALRDEQRFVRAEVARALGKLGEPVSIPPLVIALQDGDGSVRVAAAQALGMLGTHVSLEDLTPVLSDSWPPVREAAVLALGKRGEQVHIETFLAALQDEDKFVRVAVLSVLGTLEQPAIRPLVNALRDEQKQVRKAALWALLAQGKRMPLRVLRVVWQKSKKWQPIREVRVRVPCMLGKRGPQEQCAYVHDPGCATAKPTLLSRLHVPAFIVEVLPKKALLGSKHDPAEAVTAMEGYDERLVKSKIGRLIVSPSVKLAQVHIPDWAKQNKTFLVIISITLGAAFVFYRRKTIVSTVLSNALRIRRLPGDLTHKYVKSQKTSRLNVPTSSSLSTNFTVTLKPSTIASPTISQQMAGKGENIPWT